MIKRAANSEFPMANCVERIARRWGSNAVCTLGPCKGKPLPECVCKELAKYGFTSVKKMNKLAEAMSQEDPMEKCLQDQLSKGYKQAQAGIICNALKKKYATKEDENIFLMAFANEPGLTEEDTDIMNEKLTDEADIVNNAIADEGEIGDALPPVGEDAKTVTIEIPVDAAIEMKEQLEEVIEASETAPEIVEGEPELGSASDLEVADEVEFETN